MAVLGYRIIAVQNAQQRQGSSTSREETHTQTEGKVKAGEEVVKLACPGKEIHACRRNKESAWWKHMGGIVGRQHPKI